MELTPRATANLFVGANDFDNREVYVATLIQKVVLRSAKNISEDVFQGLYTVKMLDNTNPNRNSVAL